MSRIVAIGASAGGLTPLRIIIGALPARCSAAILVVVHAGRYPNVLPSVLEPCSRLPVAFAEHNAFVQLGHIYVAPPDCHMIVDGMRIRLSDAPKVHHTRPAVDPLFVSAALAHGEQVMGIVLSGGDSDGAAGLRTIKEYGGIALVQRPQDAVVPDMPEAAIEADHPERLFSHEIAQRVAAFCS